MITAFDRPHATTHSAAFARYGVASLLFALILAVVILIERAAPTGLTVLIGALGIGFASIIAAQTASTTSERRQRSSIMFGVLFPVYFGLIFGWTSLAWMTKTPTDPRATQEQVVAAFPVVLLALAGWWLGYKVASTHGPERLARRVGRVYAARGVLQPTLGRLIALYAIATLARLLLLVRGSYGFLKSATEAVTSGSVVDQMAAVVAGVAPLALLLLAYNFFQSRRATFKGLFPLGAALVLEVIFTSLSAQKNPFFLMGLSVLIAGIAVRRLTWRAALGAAVIGSVVIFPFNANYRALLRPSPGEQASTAEAGELFVTAIGQTATEFTHPTAYIGNSLEAASFRLRNIDDVSVSMTKHQTVLPYESPLAMVRRLSIVSVPRVIWPSKPVDLYGLEVTRRYFDRPDDILTSNTLTIVGDGYRYGGPLMAFLAVLYVGVLCRFLDVAFDQRRDIVLLVPLAAAIPILREGDVVGMTITFIRTYLVLLPLLWFLQGRHHAVLRRRTAAVH